MEVEQNPTPGWQGTKDAESQSRMDSALLDIGEVDFIVPDEAMDRILGRLSEEPFSDVDRAKRARRLPGTKTWKLSLDRQVGLVEANVPFGVGEDILAKSEEVFSSLVFEFESGGVEIVVEFVGGEEIVGQGQVDITVGLNGGNIGQKQADNKEQDEANQLSAGAQSCVF